VLNETLSLVNKLGMQSKCLRNRLAFV
jgi:hypothetical protein